METKPAQTSQRHCRHTVRLTFKYQKTLSSQNKAVKDRFHNQFKEEPIHHPTGILQSACIYVGVYIILYIVDIKYKYFHLYVGIFFPHWLP